MVNILERITEFLDKKGIADGFIRNIVSGFITRHTELYGDVVPFESLMERLNTNLNSINLIDPSKKGSDPIYPHVVGRYEGFDLDTISMFFSKEHLQNSQLRDDFIGVFLHELTHCAYTIKQNDIYKSEKQVFGTYTKFFDGRTTLTEGDNTYMEPIVNYISTCIFGKKNGAYLAQTANFSKLVTILDEKEIIRSAFNSDEQSFRQIFEILPEGAYEYYTDGMKWLNVTGEYGFKKANEIMTNFYSGNIPGKIKEVRALKNITQHVDSLTLIQEIDKEKKR